MFLVWRLWVVLRDCSHPKSNRTCKSIEIRRHCYEFRGGGGKQLTPATVSDTRLLSFVVGAVSPAVVVPSMLLLQEGGYGVEKGIPTLLMAAGSFDDILAITGFNTCLGVAFSTGNLSCPGEASTVFKPRHDYLRQGVGVGGRCWTPPQSHHTTEAAYPCLCPSSWSTRTGAYRVGRFTEGCFFLEQSRNV